VSVDGKHAQEMTLTSAYAWLYADYPFSNDPNSDWLHPDWWRPTRRRLDSEGTFKVTRHIVVDDVAVVGAGNWHSIVTGPATRRTDPAPDPECPSCEPSRT
jgi:hypothetical protein